MEKVMYDVRIQCTMVTVAWRHFFPWLQDLPPEVGFLFWTLLKEYSSEQTPCVCVLGGVTQ